MRRLTIVVGDTTDHGGTVTTGAGAGVVEGLAMAHVGSDVLCPLHGPTKIITGQTISSFTVSLWRLKGI